MINSNVLSKIPEYKLAPTPNVQGTAKRRGLEIVKYRDSSREAAFSNLKNSKPKQDMHNPNTRGHANKVRGNLHTFLLLDEELYAIDDR